jgi:hypothetical protein
MTYRAGRNYPLGDLRVSDAAAFVFAFAAAAAALSQGPTLQQRELLREIAARQGFPVPPAPASTGRAR